MTRNAQVVQSLHLLTSAGYGVQNNAARHAQERQEHESGGQQRGRETGYQARLQERGE